MQKIKNQNIVTFLKTNSLEIISVISIFLIFSGLLAFFMKYLGNVIVDCGREPYFAQEILKGKILYRDLFNIFGPLSYQINAVFFKIFGISLNSIRLAGSLNAIIIIYLLYSISRLFASRMVSWVTIIFIIITCTFHHWIFNYIFPYTYAMAYAFSSFLLSVLFLLLFLRYKKQIFMPLSWFFIGVSLSSKVDYFSYATLLFILTIFSVYKKEIQIKSLILAIISFLIVPAVSFSILFVQGLTLSELFTQSLLIKKYAISNSLNHFYAVAAGLYPNKICLKILVKKFLLVFTSFILAFCGAYFCLFSVKDITKEYKKFIMGFVFLFVSVCGFCFSITFHPHMNLSWMPVLSSILFVYLLILRFNFKKLEPSDDSYLLLFFIALLASQKTFFLLNFQAYGTYTFPLILIVNIIFLTKYLPKLFNFFDEQLTQKSCFIVLLGLSLFIVALRLAIPDFYAISAERGEMYGIASKASAVQKAIEYIESNVKPTESVWVIPEGIMVNFLTNRPSKSIYYNITMPYIETFGEDKIISDIEKDPPNYVILNSRDSADYGFRFICVDYGQKICKYIWSNYTLEDDISGVIDPEGPYYMDIYKRKPNK